MSFPSIEKNILQYWNDIDIFNKTLEQNKNNKIFKFFDGPPFATGKMHHGHILAGTIKDVIARYKHQTGYSVPRRFGYDCHGLPVENEINKKYNISSRQQILEKGIDWYNEECRSIVDTYSKDWEQTTGRLGRWIDFKNDYKTMYPEYMSSVWSIFKNMWNKDLVYKDYKVMPFSTVLGTPLSKNEISQENYKIVTDPTVIVAFRQVITCISEVVLYFLVWTTTPWTLIDNVALCINTSLEYIVVKKVDREGDNRNYVICSSCLSILPFEYEIQFTLNSTDLIQIEYHGLFDDAIHKIVSDQYVTSDTGTGIVHLAPAFGEDDFRICNFIKEIPCSVSDEGIYKQFEGKLKDLSGLHIKSKETTKNIIKLIGNMLIKKDQINHSVPFCPRSNTPVMYKIVESYFIKVEALKDKLIALNKDINWVPEHIGSRRFHDWLENAHDWNISRNRYWGNPIPIWTNGTETICVGSLEELKELSNNYDITDMHRHHIDQITIASPSGLEPLKRIPEIFDCWFESGSMPFAQTYTNVIEPLKSEEHQADFIAEGLDQTRGWFYTLLVISTAILDQSPYKNVIVNGLILAQDGKKMSKSLKNYPEVTDILDRYGADSLRLYLIDSPAVKAEPLKFSEKGLKEITQKILIPWSNSLNFYKNCKELEEEKEDSVDASILNQWIEYELDTCVRDIRQELNEYKLNQIVTIIVEFIDKLNNWYIRLNREGIKKDSKILREVLVTFSKIMAPFAPFYSEHSYKLLGSQDSVHLTVYPEHEDVPKMDLTFMHKIIKFGRELRDKKNISLTRPILSCTVCIPDSQLPEKVIQLIKQELNILELVVVNNAEGMTLSKDNSIGMLFDENYTEEIKLLHKTRLLKSNVKKFRKILKLRSTDKRDLYINNPDFIDFDIGYPIKIYNGEDSDELSVDILGISIILYLSK